MKHLLYTAALLLMAASCSNKEMEQITESGKAKMQFHISTSECPVQIISRATPIPEVETFIVSISGNEGVVTQKTLQELQQESPLFLEATDNGTEYKVEAYSCENPGEAVLDKPYFYASKTYTVMKDETVTAELECSLQQFQVSFVPSSEFMSSFRTNEKVDEHGGEYFSLTVSDANGREVNYTYADLDKSAYFYGIGEGKTSTYIKINIKGTTIKGFPVNFTETIIPEDGLLTVKDHLIITLNVSENQSLNVNATQIEL